ncbi:hypothetical protein SAMN04244575_03425 [Sinorhizobium meliloti]|nr:hypothetical protein SAMN04244575_03425 [Sinorhizobium meliloti]
MTQPCGGTLAEFAAVLAEHDNPAAAVFLGPLRHVNMAAMEGARHEMMIGCEVVVIAHIDDDGRLGSTNETSEFFG